MSAISEHDVLPAAATPYGNTHIDVTIEEESKVSSQGNAVSPSIRGDLVEP